MNSTNNLLLKSVFSLLIRAQLLLAFKPSLNKQKGVNEWSHISMESMTDFKRCEFRQINVLCMADELSITGQQSLCQLNCNYRGYNLGICYSEPGPGNEPSGEWEQRRGAHYCYCSLCHNDKCMQYCQEFGLATGYCHESPTYGTGCKCVGCDASFCGKHCNSVYGTALQQSFCRHNDCKCLAKTCGQN